MGMARRLRERGRRGVARITGADVLDRVRNRYPSGVMTHQAPQKSRTAARRLVRRAAIALSAAVVALVMLPAAALADTPEAWDDAPHVSGFQFVLVLFLIPAGLFLVIALFSALPSMIGDKGYEPGQTWRSEAEWFGGASKGVESADAVTPAQIESGDSDRGGTSGAW